MPKPVYNNMYLPENMPESGVFALSPIAIVIDKRRHKC